MAEIKVQRKGPSGWLWMLGLVATVVLVWVVVAMFRAPDPITATVQTPAAEPPTPLQTAPTSGVSGAPLPAVADFLTFKDASVGSPAGPAHEYTADGIRRLTRALDAVIEMETVAGSPIRDRLADWRAKADRIQADPQAPGHANQVRDVFTGAADLLSAVQQDRWPNATNFRVSIDEIRQAAAAIDGSRPLLDQTDKVKAFFDRAGAAFVAMPAAAHR